MSDLVVGHAPSEQRERWWNPCFVQRACNACGMPGKQARQLLREMWQKAGLYMPSMLGDKRA